MRPLIYRLSVNYFINEIVALAGQVICAAFAPGFLSLNKKLVSNPEKGVLRVFSVLGGSGRVCECGFLILICGYFVKEC